MRSEVVDDGKVELVFRTQEAAEAVAAFLSSLDWPKIKRVPAAWPDEDGKRFLVSVELASSQPEDVAYVRGVLDGWANGVEGEDDDH